MPSPSLQAGRRSGFTLIEMLVSMGIFAIITGLVIANFRGGKQGDELRIAAQLIGSEVRRTQTMAVGAEVVPWCVGGSNAGAVCLSGDSQCPGGECIRDVPRGYGLRLSSSGPDTAKVIGFADINGDGVFQPEEETRRDNIALSPSITVSSLSPSSSGSLDIVFTPPRPTVSFNGNAADPLATVTVTHSATSQTRTVTINKVSGQVSVE
jgi:prepilin-type N-terminal cleavage/methylation domain-containing protein